MTRSRRVVELPEEFGSRIKSELALRGLTVGELAERVGVDRRHLSSVLSRKVDPSVLLVNSMRFVLGQTTVAWALGQGPRPAPLATRKEQPCTAAP